MVDSSEETEGGFILLLRVLRKRDCAGGEGREGAVLRCGEKLGEREEGLDLGDFAG